MEYWKKWNNGQNHDTSENRNHGMMEEWAKAWNNRKVKLQDIALQFFGFLPIIPMFQYSSIPKIKREAPWSTSKN
jgi:hypothetical protein